MRTISFNPDVVHNDGLIASSIARRQRISFEKASMIVDKEVESMKEQLKLDGELSMGKLGRFVDQAESTLVFEPSRRLEEAAACYLEPFEIATLAAREEARELEEVAAVSARRSKLSKATRIVSKVAAVLVALVGIGMLLSTPLFFDRNDSLASMSMTVPKSSQTALIPTETNVAKTLKIFIPNEAETAKEPQDAIEAKATVLAKEAETVAATEAVAASENSQTATMAVDRLRFDTADRYCLIVASFPSKTQAEQFIGEHADRKLSILAQDGKFRVFAATGATSSQALAQRDFEQIGQAFPDSWVCRRR